MYTSDYVRKHKNEIGDLYGCFKAAFNANLKQMDGYEERLDEWYKNMDELLTKIKKSRIKNKK